MAIIASIVVGFFLMIPLSALFDAMGWSFFHTWALVHGTWIVAWPGLAAISCPHVSAIDELAANHFARSGGTQAICQDRSSRNPMIRLCRSNPGVL